MIFSIKSMTRYILLLSGLPVVVFALIVWLSAIQGNIGKAWFVGVIVLHVYLCFRITPKIVKALKLPFNYGYICKRNISGIEVVKIDSLKIIEYYSFMMINIKKKFSIGYNIAYASNPDGESNDPATNQLYLDSIIQRSKDELKKVQEKKERKKSKNKVITVARINTEGDDVDYDLANKIAVFLKKVKPT